jgi:hypothetical protein
VCLPLPCLARDVLLFCGNVFNTLLPRNGCTWSLSTVVWRHCLQVNVFIASLPSNKRPIFLRICFYGDVFNTLLPSNGCTCNNTSHCSLRKAVRPELPIGVPPALHFRVFCLRRLTFPLFFRSVHCPSAPIAPSLRLARPERFTYKAPVSPSSRHHPKVFFPLLFFFPRWAINPGVASASAYPALPTLMLLVGFSSVLQGADPSTMPSPWFSALEGPDLSTRSSSSFSATQQ